MLLALAAEHRLILVGHAAAALGVGRRSAGARLARLSRIGLLSTGQPLGDQRFYQATRAGLELAERDLPRPAAVRPSSYEHDVGMAWVWLAAQRGAFGPRAQAALRARDALPGRAAPARRRRARRCSGCRSTSVGPAGGERRHYPDLLVETTDGRRIAVELELSPKSRRARERVLRAYGGQSRIDAVVYLTDRPGIGRAVVASARRQWVDDLVTVRTIAFGPGSGGITPGRTGRARRPRETGRGARPRRRRSRDPRAPGRAGEPGATPPHPPYWLLAVFVAVFVVPPAWAVGIIAATVAVRGGLGLARAALARERAPSARAAAIGPDHRARHRPGRGDVALGERQLAAHGLIVGASGAGKTTTLLRIVGAQVARGRPVIAIDLKGSPEFARRLGAVATAAGRPLRVFSLDGPERWNPLAVGNPTELKDKLIATERFTEPHYQRAAERYVQSALQVLAAGGRPATLDRGGRADGARPARRAGAQARVPARAGAWRPT